MSGPPVAAESTLRLSVPSEGIRAGDLILRFPSLDDVDAILPAFTDPELREAGNLPAFGREELVASLRELPMLAEQGRLMALAAVDAQTGEVVGGATLHHLDAERGIVEIGYFVLPHARRRGFATTIARLLAEHAFTLGIGRVAAYVNVGNTGSERVLDRAGFTGEGVVRSMPKPEDASTRPSTHSSPTTDGELGRQAANVVVGNGDPASYRVEGGIFGTQAEVCARPNSGAGSDVRPSS